MANQMNFQNLPKSLFHHNSILPVFSSSTTPPFISSSYFQSLVPVLDQIKILIEEDNRNEDLLTLMNPFMLVFFSFFGRLVKPQVSKLKVQQNIFYCFQEIFALLNIWKTHKNFFYFGNYPEDFDNFSTYYKGKYHVASREIPNAKFVCYDIKKMYLQDNQKYCVELVYILQNICETFQKSDSCVIVLDHLFLKPVIECIFIFTSMFSKTFLVKPTISNPTTFEKILVCQNFQLDGIKTENLKQKLNEVISSVQNNSTLFLSSLLSCDLPIYFVNKIEDINVVFGQNQIDVLHQVINIANSKSRDEKVDNLQKHGLQKSCQWCEKFDVPYNKYAERPNIFRDEKEKKKESDKEREREREREKEKEKEKELELAENQINFRELASSEDSTSV
jgi:hypothetical protein